MSSQLLKPSDGSRGFAYLNRSDQRLEDLVGQGWRPATRREWLWFQVQTNKRFSWLETIAIFAVAATVHVLTWHS